MFSALLTMKYRLSFTPAGMVSIVSGLDLRMSNTRVLSRNLFLYGRSYPASALDSSPTSIDIFGVSETSVAVRRDDARRATHGANVVTVDVVEVTDVVINNVAEDEDVVTSDAAEHADDVTSDVAADADDVTSDVAEDADVVTSDAAEDADDVTSDATRDVDVVTISI